MSSSNERHQEELYHNAVTYSYKKSADVMRIGSPHSRPFWIVNAMIQLENVKLFLRRP